MKNKPHIYRRQIVATGKYYIGKHNGNNINYIGSGIEFKKDYKIYVKNKKLDLIEEILEYVNDISELNKREVYWLNKFDVINNSLYYNKTNKSYGVCKTEEHTKIKQSLASPKRKKIIQYDLEGNFIKIWDCMSDVTRQLNIETGDLTCVCQGKQKTAGGFQWKYFIIDNKVKIEAVSYIRTEEFKQNLSIKLKGKPSSMKGIYKYQPILQYDLEGNFIKEYINPMEAVNNDRKKVKNLITCLKNRQKTAYGFIWKYK